VVAWHGGPLLGDATRGGADVCRVPGSWRNGGLCMLAGVRCGAINCHAYASCELSRVVL
jgi:hypothetical protein